MPSRRRSGSKRSDRPKPPSVPRPSAPGGGALSGGTSSRDPDAAARWSLPRSRSLADWPVHEAFVNAGWEAVSQLATVNIARRHPRHESVAFGSFVVDLQCLGIKSVIYKRHRDLLDYERRTRSLLLLSDMDLIPVAPALAAKIVAEGLAYAESLGFDPPPDFETARVVFDGLDPNDDPTPVPVGGKDGKPHFIAGPYDDRRAIINQLAERLGPDGFHATLVFEGESGQHLLEDFVNANDFDSVDQDDDPDDDPQGTGSVSGRGA